MKGESSSQSTVAYQALQRHAATPVIDGDTDTVASTSIGTIRLLITKSGAGHKATRAWEALSVKTVIGSPIQAGDTIYTLGPGISTRSSGISTRSPSISTQS